MSTSAFAPHLPSKNGSGNGAEKVKVLFFTSALGGGGAEKHLLRVINHLDRERFRVSLALVKPGGEFERALAADVKTHFLTASGKGSTTVRMLRAVEPLRRVVKQEQPDLIFSVIDLANIVSLISTRGVAAQPKIILGVQTPPSIAYRHSKHPVGRLILRLLPRLYPKADQIVALSNGVAADLVSLAPTMKSRMSVIYNAGFEAEVLDRARESISPSELPPPPLIVACGRLKALKGFSYLIDALARVREQIPAHLCIIGEGEERPVLEKKIKRMGLAGCVRLLGFQENPFKYMAAADLFVLSSLFEGFGNVIVEAMACGAPVIATDCPCGPGEIIQDGHDGLLVPPANSEALAQGIIRVLKDEALKKRLSENGRARANDFNAEIIAGRYGELFLTVLNGSRVAATAGNGKGAALK